MKTKPTLPAALFGALAFTTTSRYEVAPAVASAATREGTGGA